MTRNLYRSTRAPLIPKIAIGATIAFVLGIAVHEARHGSSLRSEAQTLQREAAALSADFRQANQARDEAAARLAAALRQQAQLRRDAAETDRLTAKVGQSQAGPGIWRN